MSKKINRNYNLVARLPLDDRTVVADKDGLSALAFTYNGLLTWVVSDNSFYIYNNGWTLYPPEVQTLTWGSIEGSIQLQDDLMLMLNNKLNKVGGIISGNLTIQGRLKPSFIEFEGISLSELLVRSRLDGEPLGSTRIDNIVKISAADYAQAELNGTLVPTTYYLIT